MKYRSLQVRRLPVSSPSFGEQSAYKQSSAATAVWIGASLSLPAMTAKSAYTSRNSDCCCCASRLKQSGHKQSLASAGNGNRNDSSAHQQPPDGLQENSIPQAEQARRRGPEVSDRFVMNWVGFQR